MARKNLIGISVDDAPPGDVVSATAGSPRPLAGFTAPSVRNTPIGGITKTLGTITEKVVRANDLEKQLAAGQAIVEVDPESVDSSFIRDRIDIEATEIEQLIEQIREHGQQVPILVRPHPDLRGRYQVAYGHRRLLATRRLGLKIKAVVRELSDDQLVVSQGQENNVRTNLSYIERALFAVRLEDRNFSRDIIMSAIGVDKAALSKMISVARQVPIQVIEAIGAAPEIGRRRWMDLAGKLQKADADALLARLRTPEVADLSSNQRFEVASEAITKMPKKAASADPIRSWNPPDKSVSVSLKDNGKSATLVIGATNGSRFAAYLTDRLEELYADWKSQQET